MLGAVEFDFPSNRPNNRFVGGRIHIAAVRAFMAANRARLVRVSVDMHHVGHRPDYTAD